MGMSVWAPWAGGAASVSSCGRGHWLQQTLDIINTAEWDNKRPDMIRAALLTLACTLVCHAKEANIKFISGPEVITDLGKFSCWCTLESRVYCVLFHQGNLSAWFAKLRMAKLIQLSGWRRMVTGTLYLCPLEETWLWRTRQSTTWGKIFLYFVLDCDTMMTIVTRRLVRRSSWPWRSPRRRSLTARCISARSWWASTRGWRSRWTSRSGPRWGWRTARPPSWRWWRVRGRAWTAWPGASPPPGSSGPGGTVGWWPMASRHSPASHSSE